MYHCLHERGYQGKGRHGGLCLGRRVGLGKPLVSPSQDAVRFDKQGEDFEGGVSKAMDVSALGIEKTWVRGDRGKRGDKKEGDATWVWLVLYVYIYIFIPSR